MNYTNNINSSGHKLTIDVQYSDSQETENAFIDDSLAIENNTTTEDSKNTLIQTDYVFVDKEDSKAWNEGLKFYLKNHNNHGMIIWRSNLICDSNFIEAMVVSNCPVSQPIVCSKTYTKIFR